MSTELKFVGLISRLSNSLSMTVFFSQDEKSKEVSCINIINFFKLFFTFSVVSYNYGQLVLYLVFNPKTKYISLFLDALFNKSELH